MLLEPAIFDFEAFLMLQSQTLIEKADAFEKEGRPQEAKLARELALSYQDQALRAPRAEA